MDISLGPATLTINPATQLDVLQALTQNTAFPDRAITIGEISAQYASGDIPIGLGGGANVSLSASFSAGAHSGIGVFTTAANAVASLGLDPSVTPDFPAGADDRFLLLSFDANAQGSVSGSAPIGVIGSVSFGAKAAGATRFAVVYRFNKTTGARTVIEQAGQCIKLPRQVNTAADLAQGAWIIAEVDGSLGLSLAASVGYDYTYTRDLPDQLQKLGFSSDLSVSVHAAATATVGYNVSGRYLVMLGRPSLAADQVIALQVNKGSSYGYNFGLNLSAAVQMSQILPASGEDLVAASFGVFGPQIVADVSNSIATLQAWSSGDLAANTAALTIKTAKSLLNAVTGINVDASIAEATGVLKDALTKWNNLVQKGSTELQTLAWNLLGNPADKALILQLLTDLQQNASFNKAISDGLQSLPGQNWLMAISDVIDANSVLTLGDHQADVQKIAGYALDVLSSGSGNIVAKLQQYILDRFHLTTIIATATAPAKLDQWVQDRLAAFLNKSGLISDDLKKIQSAISTLLTKFDNLYAETAAALTKKYNFTFAASYQKVVDNSTLLNLSFDLSKGGADLYHQVVTGNTSALFQIAGPIPGLTINSAVMTHGVHSTAKTSLTIPYLSTATSDVVSSVAKLTFDRNGANLVGYLDSSDQVTGDRYSSMLKLALQFGLAQSSITSIDGSLAYETRNTVQAASKTEVALVTTPFVNAYLADKFAPNQYSDKFLTDFDIAVALPTSEFGDMLMSMQLAVDGDFISAWVARDAQQLKNAQIAASTIVQKMLRQYTHTLYFQTPADTNSWKTPALLAWEAFPICTGITWDAGAETLSATNTAKHYYMNDEELDDNLLKALVNASALSGSNLPAGWGMLNTHVTFAYQELVAAGVKNNFVFSPTAQATSQIHGYAISDANTFGYVQGLAHAEAAVVKAVAKALADLSAAAAAISVNDPSKLLDRLAKFGAELTQSLNKNMDNRFAGKNLRLYGTMLFVELTKALGAASTGIQPKAMLELKSLKPGHTFDIATYVTGSEPTADQVAVSQTVVSL